jgi:glycosyltransferase involved in cell wall biosynthesis
MGTYPPRECGIATFNQDLLHSSQRYLGTSVACKVAAVNLSPLDTYRYTPDVEWEIDQNSKAEYTDLAVRFNGNSHISGVMIQHEYGIYGGRDGEYIVSFMERCTKPIMVTLHTVLPDPELKMKLTTDRIIQRANIVVVLTQRSKEIVESVYPQSIGKLHVIPHGIHATNFSGTGKAKKKLKMTHKTVLSTFGLLNRGKGIEYVINALPAVVKMHPDIRYLILGETHPVIRRSEGERYRKELARLITKLHLKKYVKFYDQYLPLTDLIEFLKATDIYISSSINPNQAVSGTLSYALGTGRAVISTEFTQAKEIISEDTGRLVPIKNSEAISKAIVELLTNKAKLRLMHKNAYRLTRPMLWSNVAHEYSKLLIQHILPPINLAHLSKMTDEFGLFQFARLTKPDENFGYTLDDNARALVVCCWLKDYSVKPVDSLMRTYLQFIARCQLPDGTFINYVDHAGKVATNQNRQEDLEDATARAMWALSEVLNTTTISAGLRNEALAIFERGVPHTKHFFHIRSSALMIKSLSTIISIFPALRKKYLSWIKDYANFLSEEYARNSVKTWNWFDDYLGYNNAIIPESMLIAGQVTKNRAYTDIGNATFKFLINKTFSSNKYIPIGHSHWYKHKQKRSHFDQQPEDPASMITALTTAYGITGEETYRNLITVCFSWFLGNNSLQQPLYNYDDGGCFDGLHPDRVNLNQGAESQVSYLLSRLSMTRINQI